jgi:hypothetical protein
MLAQYSQGEGLKLNAKLGARPASGESSSCAFAGPSLALPDVP